MKGQELSPGPTGIVAAEETPIAPQLEHRIPAPASPRWSFAKRFLFRFALVYFLLYTHPFPLNVLPSPSRIVGTITGEPAGELLVDPVFDAIGWYSGKVQVAEQWAVDATASAVFGFDEPLDRPFGSGDPTWGYVQFALYVTLALLLASVWSYLARRRPTHARLAPWLHLAARYALAFPMFGYGFAKIFPSQFRTPSLARLVSDYGDSSPMNVLWTFMGTSPAYTVFAGAGEVLAGVLLCFRRTSTLGALVALGVMTNVAALNYCYDVPVKLYSTHLLLLAALLTLPDVRRLLDVHLFNRPVDARDLSAPRFRWMSGHALKLLIVGSSVALSVTGVVRSYAAADDPGPYYGIWDVERFAERTEDGTFVDAESGDWLALLIERERGGRGGGWFQVPDHSLRLAGPTWDEERAKLTLASRSRWAYREEGDTLVLQGEFQRTFRKTPSDFKDPGIPRAPQIELELRRDGAAGAPSIDPEIPVGPQVAVAPELEGAKPPPEPDEGSDGETSAPAPAPLPKSLVGRWTVARSDMIGDSYTRRRADPAGWTAMTLTGEGTAVFEFEDRRTETYAAAVEPERAMLQFAWSSEFTVEDGGADRLVLRGEHRGRILEVELARRDLDSFLLVRRGYHWINEIPLNRF